MSVVLKTFMPHLMVKGGKHSGLPSAQQDKQNRSNFKEKYSRFTQFFCPIW